MLLDLTTAVCLQYASPQTTVHYTLRDHILFEDIALDSNEHAARIHMLYQEEQEAPPLLFANLPKILCYAEPAVVICVWSDESFQTICQSGDRPKDTNLRLLNTKYWSLVKPKNQSSSLSYWIVLNMSHGMDPHLTDWQRFQKLRMAVSYSFEIILIGAPPGTLVNPSNWIHDYDAKSIRAIELMTQYKG